MLLLWLLVAAQLGPSAAERERNARRDPAGRAQATTDGRPPYDLTHYLIIANRYRSADRDAARREIREWRRAEIDAAVGALRKTEDRLRAIPVQPDDIDFRTIEAAVLMHAEAGLLSLQALDEVEADTHLRASATLYQWSSGAATTARNWAGARRRAFGDTVGTVGLEIRERIDRRDYFVALAAAALAVGFPSKAQPFAKEARQAAPLDPEVQLVSGCVAASLADEHALRHRDSDAARTREAAEKALRDALALDPGLQEARLRLGRLLLDERRAIEAEALLAEVDERGVDDRQRYLARLFLGRVADRRGRPEEAARLYRRALEAWPDSQAARFALGHATEKSSGPAAARPQVAASLAASQRPDRIADPWWLYFFGPPGLAKAALDRVWAKALDR